MSRTEATDWPELQRDLMDLLTAQIYPALAGNAFYAALLARAGLSAKQVSVPPAARNTLATHARAEAARIVQTCMPHGASELLVATLLHGPLQLCGSGGLWFPEELRAVARREVQERGNEGLEGESRWLRTWLGASAEAEITGKYLPANALAPAIEISGPPRRRFDRHSWRCPGVPHYRYWAEIDRETGSVPRYLLPYL